MDVRIKRAYEPASPEDGFRVLVDRLWPRGVSKDRAQIDLWQKEAAPSTGLRRAWHADPAGHSPEHFAAFADDYRAELSREPALTALDELFALAQKHSPLTLVYGAKDTETNHAVVLRDALLARAARV